jgi:hypothetical protein
MAVALISLTGCWALLDIGNLTSKDGDAGLGGNDAPSDGRDDVTALCAATPGRGDGAAPPTLTCNATTTDVLGSPTACGACGHDCAGGNCAAGVCSMVDLFRPPPSMVLLNAAPVDGGLWVAGQVYNEAGTGYVSTSVNALTDAGLLTLATYPPGPTLLSAIYDPPVVTFEDGTGFRFGRVDDADAGLALVGFGTSGFAITTDQLYAIRKDGAIFDIDRTTHQVTPFADVQNARRFIVADDREVYWISEPNEGGTTGEIRRRSRTGSGGVEPLLPVSNPGGLALDSTYVYFATLSDGTGSILRLRRDVHQNPESLGTLDDPALSASTWSALAIDGCSCDEAIFWSRPPTAGEEGPLYWLLKVGPGLRDITVVEVPRCGGAPRRALFMHDVGTLSAAGPYYHVTNGADLQRGAR